MKKFKYLVKYGLKKRIFTKAFVISNVIVGLIVLGITLLPMIISSFTSEPETYHGTIWVLNQSEYDVDQIFDDLYPNNGPIENEVIFELVTDETYMETFYDLEEAADAMIVVEVVDEIVMIRLYNRSLDYASSLFIQDGLRNLQRLIYAQETNIDPGLVADTPTIIVANPHATDDTQMAIATTISTFLIIPLFILITTGVQFIGSEIIEEKSTKAIEIIIASVPPRTHFIAKISSIILFLLLQMLLYASFAILGVIINDALAGGGSGATWDIFLGGMGSLILETLVITFIVSILGSLLYLVIGAFIASLAINMEDYQQIQTPVMSILMLSYFGSIMASTMGSGVLLNILLYIPFASPMVIPASFLGGFIGWLEVLLSMGVLMLSIVLVVLLFAPAYRGSILSYDQSKLFKRIKNSFRQAKALKQNQKSYEENQRN